MEADVAVVGAVVVGTGMVMRRRKTRVGRGGQEREVERRGEEAAHRKCLRGISAGVPDALVASRSQFLFYP